MALIIEPLLQHIHHHYENSWVRTLEQDDVTSYGLQKLAEHLESSHSTMSLALDNVLPASIIAGRVGLCN